VTWSASRNAARKRLDIADLLARVSEDIWTILHHRKQSGAICIPGTCPVYLKQVICPVSDLSRRSLRSVGRGVDDKMSRFTMAILSWYSVPVHLTVKSIFLTSNSGKDTTSFTNIFAGHPCFLDVCNFLYLLWWLWSSSCYIIQMKFGIPCMHAV